MSLLFILYIIVYSRYYGPPSTFKSSASAVWLLRLSCENNKSNTNVKVRKQSGKGGSCALRAGVIRDGFSCPLTLLRELFEKQQPHVSLTLGEMIVDRLL